MATLYVGTDPSRYVCCGELVHYPVIQTVPIAYLDEEIRLQCAACTHWLFTSPNAVKHWVALRVQWKKKQVFAVGPSTVSCLAHYGVFAKQPAQVTQEGLIELLETVDLENAFVGWPRSSLSRPFLSRYLTQRAVQYLAIDLYTTISQKLEPVPDLKMFDEIVFTSPSTVRAFIEIFGKIPSEKKITSIGPITAEALRLNGSLL